MLQCATLKCMHFLSFGKRPLKLMHIWSSKHSADFLYIAGHANEMPGLQLPSKRLLLLLLLLKRLLLLFPAMRAAARGATKVPGLHVPVQRLRSSGGAPADPRPAAPAHSSLLPAAAWLFVPIRQPRYLAPFFSPPNPTT